MSAEIYYFSGSGNSLAIGRDLARKLNGPLLSIAAAVDQERIKTDANMIGIVCPVYYASLGGRGIPLIVERFVKKLEDARSKYIFAVCTHSGAPGSTIENLGRLIASEGGHLAVGFAVKMSNPIPAAAKIRHFLFHKQLEADAQTDIEATRQLSAAWQKQLEVIYRCVIAGKEGQFQTRSRVAKIVLAPIVALQNKLAVSRYQKLADSSGQSLDQLIPAADRSFHHDLNCSGCGICVRVCPVNNVKMVDRKPVWRHGCETCLACFQWCPRGAIRGDIVEYEKRYHHPDVKLADMLRRNGLEPAFSDLLASMPPAPNGEVVR